MDKCYGIIYEATNKINKKIYIGQTTESLDKRIHGHVNAALSKRDNFYFHNAIRECGKENFEWEIIAKCNSLEELNNVEIEMIEKYNTFGDGYNLNIGGNGNAGFNHTKKAKQRMSEANKGKKHPLYGKHRSEETKRKIGDANKTKSRSKELRKRISEALKGKKHPLYGKHRSEETKKKISDSNRGKICSKGNKNPLAKKYIITTPGGEELFVYGILDFCRSYKEEKLNCYLLIRIAKGKQKQHRGYKCKYWEEEKCSII